MEKRKNIEKIKAEIRAEILKKYNRSKKEDYLMAMGFFKKSALDKMKIKKINKLMENALIVKGF